MAEKQSRQTKVKESKKQLAETQKIFDTARVREYDIQELLTYYLTDTSALFDAEGLMVKPNKSDLCSELEKMLEPTDYVQPSAWTPANTTAIVDVMAHLRHMRLANLNTFGDLCSHFLGYVSNTYMYIKSKPRSYYLNFHYFLQSCIPEKNLLLSREIAS